MSTSETVTGMFVKALWWHWQGNPAGRAIMGRAAKMVRVVRQDDLTGRRRSAASLVEASRRASKFSLGRQVDALRRGSALTDAELHAEIGRLSPPWP